MCLCVCCGFVVVDGVGGGHLLHVGGVLCKCVSLVVCVAGVLCVWCVSLEPATWMCDHLSRLCQGVLSQKMRNCNTRPCPSYYIQ